MRKLFKEKKLFKGGNYMRKYGNWIFDDSFHIQGVLPRIYKGPSNLYQSLSYVFLKAPFC